MIGADTSFLIQLEIAELPLHSKAHEFLQRHVLAANEQIALAPQVLAEMIHIVTDPRRFQFPLTMEQALAKASFWWNAREVQHIYPTAESTSLWLEWLSQKGLGRKRLLDTQLAAIFWTAGVRKIVTSNARDFAIFAGFEIVSP
jgi:predicted nucleic acid-binding protein